MGNLQAVELGHNSGIYALAAGTWQRAASEVMNGFNTAGARSTELS